MSDRSSRPAKVQKISYGNDPSQFGELTHPAGEPRGVVVVIHGGFWKSAYDLSLGRPLAADLAERGWIAWNIEYRRVGNGGGWPMTGNDVSDAIDKLGSMSDVPTTKVTSLGHSAGGQLAVWAGARRDPKVPLTGAIAQAGVLDLVTAAAAHLGGDAVQAFMGDAPLAAADPLQQVPLNLPVWCIHGDQDNNVPLNQSTNYVAAAKAAGAKAELIKVSGDHFTLIDPKSAAWSKIIQILTAT